MNAVAAADSHLGQDIEKDAAFSCAFTLRSLPTR
jgi:hypothetical protein